MDGLHFIDVGMPQDRRARLAARRAFVDLKHDFMMATAGLPGSRGEWLRECIRRAEDPYRLWLLRNSVFAALDGNDADVRIVRRSLKFSLDSMFSEPELSSVPTR